MKINKKNENEELTKVTPKFLCMVGIVLLCMLLGMYNSVLSYCALLLSILMVFICSEEEYLAFLMFIMPFASIFKSNPDSQSFFTYLILFYVIYCLTFKNKLKTSFVLLFATLLAYLFIQMLISINILRSIKFVVNLILVYYALRLNSGTNRKNVMLFYILGVIMSSSIAALNIFPVWTNYIKENILSGQVDVHRFSGLYADPNYYSINVIISLCLVVILNHKKLLSNISSIFCSVVLLIFAIMTVSKSAFLMLVFPATLFLYAKIKQQKYFVSLCLLILSVFVVMSILDGRFDFLKTILSRFNSNGDLNSLTTGRFEIWKSYLNYFEESGLSVFWGNGFGADLLNSKVAHNTYIDLIYYLGIFGTAVVLAVVVCIISIKDGNQKNLLNYSILMCVLVMYFFLSELFYFDWPFHLILVGIVLKSDLKKDVLQK